MEIDVEQYYRKYAPMVLRRCRFLLKDEEKALDAMQEVFVKLLQNRGRLKDSYPSSLLYRMATNVCLNVIRSEKRGPETDGSDMLARIAEYDDSAENFMVKDLLDKIFNRELQSTREMAVMYYIDNMTLKEVADATGLSVSGVRKRLKNLQGRANNLKEVLDEQ